MSQIPATAPPPGMPGVATTAIYVTEAPLGPDPRQMQCPQCRAMIFTEIKSVPGCFTYLISGLLCLFGCGLGCCLIPCCIADCQDTEHRCPNCHHFIGTHRKMN